MLRNMKLGLSVLVSILCLGLMSPAFAGDEFEDRFADRDEILEDLILDNRPGLRLGQFRDPFVDREDLLVELLLRERLFGVGRFGLLGRVDPFTNVLLTELLIQEAIEDAIEDAIEEPFERPDVLEFDDLFEFDEDDDDD